MKEITLLPHPGPTPLSKRRSRPTKVWDQVAALLRKKPGEWVVSPQQWPASTTINNGTLRAFRPAGHFEAARLEGALLIRYVGASEGE